MTCTKHKKWNWITHLFSMSSFSQPAIATPISIKRIEPLCLSDSSGMHYPLDNTYHWTFWPNKLSIPDRGNETSRLTLPTDKNAAFCSRQQVKGILPLSQWICRKSITWYSASTGIRFKEQRAIRLRRKNPGHFITRLFPKGRPNNNQI